MIIFCLEMITYLEAGLLLAVRLTYLLAGVPFMLAGFVFGFAREAFSVGLAFYDVLSFAEPEEDASRKTQSSV